jgi:hypothetical protein
VPALVYGLHFLALALGPGIGWTIHLWLGAVVLGGLMGVLVAVVARSPAPLAA